VTTERNISGEFEGHEIPLSSASSERIVPEGQAEFDISLLPAGSCLELRTGHHSYFLLNLGEGRVEICGHPQYCPEPTIVSLHRSNLGVGRRFEFRHPIHNLVSTSRIVAIRLVA
jgi:hypothetical protein